MQKEFVEYELALRLKALGFDEPCIAFATMEYKDVIHCGVRFKVHKESDLPTKPFGVPTWQSAFRWFREKHYLISSIYQLGVSVKTGLSSFEYMIDKLNNLGLSQFIEDFPYNTYEEAEIACLENLIELVESKSE